MSSEVEVPDRIYRIVGILLALVNYVTQGGHEQDLYPNTNKLCDELREIKRKLGDKFGISRQALIEQGYLELLEAVGLVQIGERPRRKIIYPTPLTYYFLEVAMNSGEILGVDILGEHKKKFYEALENFAKKFVIPKTDSSIGLSLLGYIIRFFERKIREARADLEDQFVRVLAVLLGYAAVRLINALKNIVREPLNTNNFWGRVSPILEELFDVAFSVYQDSLNVFYLIAKCLRYCQAIT